MMIGTHATPLAAADMTREKSFLTMEPTDMPGLGESELSASCMGGMPGKHRWSAIWSSFQASYGISNAASLGVGGDYATRDTRTTADGGDDAMAEATIDGKWRIAGDSQLGWSLAVDGGLAIPLDSPRRQASRDAGPGQPQMEAAAILQRGESWGAVVGSAACDGIMADGSGELDARCSVGVGCFLLTTLMTDTEFQYAIAIDGAWSRVDLVAGGMLGTAMGSLGAGCRYSDMRLQAGTSDAWFSWIAVWERDF